jgi:hypothetical protein
MTDFGWVVRSKATANTDLNPYAAIPAHCRRRWIQRHKYFKRNDTGLLAVVECPALADNGTQMLPESVNDSLCLP